MRPTASPVSRSALGPVICGTDWSVESGAARVVAEGLAGQLGLAVLPIYVDQIGPWTNTLRGVQVEVGDPAEVLAQAAERDAGAAHRGWDAWPRNADPLSQPRPGGNGPGAGADRAAALPPSALHERCGNRADESRRAGTGSLTWRPRWALGVRARPGRGGSRSGSARRGCASRASRARSRGGGRPSSC